MLIQELTHQLKVKAMLEAAKAQLALKTAERAKASPGSGGSEDPSLCPECHFAKILCECEDKEEEDDDEEEFEVDEEVWGEALKLIFEGLDSLDRLVEDDRVHLPEGMKFLLMSRRIDVWDFLSEHASPEQIAEYQGTSDIHRSEK